MDYEEFIKSKKKDELTTIARNLKITGYSKLSIGRLRIEILKLKGTKGFKKALNLERPWYSKLKLPFWITLFFGCLWFILSQISQKKNSSKIISNQDEIISSVSTNENLIRETHNASKEQSNTFHDSVIQNQKQILEIIKPKANKDGPITEREYDRLLERSEKLNNILLKDFYGENFQVYGQLNNHLYKNSRTFNSSIKIDGEKLVLNLDLEEITFPNDPNFGAASITVKDFTKISKIPGGKLSLGQRFRINFFDLRGRDLWITILDENINHPIYALGFNKIPQRF